jgi:hypothetical protein
MRGKTKESGASMLSDTIKFRRAIHESPGGPAAIEPSIKSMTVNFSLDGRQVRGPHGEHLA